MKKLTRKIRKLMHAAAKGFYFLLHKNPNHTFDDGAYYIVMGDKLLSLRPFRGWSEAYRHAKLVHRIAFIIKGSSLNGALKKNQWQAHKKMWGIYAAR